MLFCGLTCEGRGGDPRGRLPGGLPRLLHAMRMLRQYNFATLCRRGRLGFRPVADPSPEGGYFVTSWISHWPRIETSTRTTSPASYTRSTRNEYRNISQHIAAVTIAVTRYRIKVHFFMALIFNLFDMFVIHAGAGGAGSPRGFIVRSEGTITPQIRVWLTPSGSGTRRYFRPRSTKGSPFRLFRIAARSI